MKDIIRFAAESHFRLTEQNIGDFSELKGRGMHFHTKVYDAVDSGDAGEIGRLCMMDMKAAAGFMRMETGVFSPVGLDGPVFSFDYVKAFGKETLFVEFYDTTVSHPDFAGLGEIKKRCSHIPDYDPGEHWYDSMRLPVSDFRRGRKITEELSRMLKEYCDGYFRLVRCPNYLGELLLWTGVFVIGIGSGMGILQWIVCLLGYTGIIYVMFSGARRLEMRQNRVYGDDPEYQKYARTVPIMIPFIPLYSVEKHKWLVA